MKSIQIPKEIRQAYLQSAPEERPGTRADIIAECRRIACERARPERTGFPALLAELLRLEGLPIAGSQLWMLCLVCLALRSLPEAVRLLPGLGPLFFLAASPALFRSQRFGMTELEAVTRHSNIRLLLAKLVLVAGSDLVCLALPLVLRLCDMLGFGVFRALLCVLPPYLLCLAGMLYLFRKRGTDGYRLCVGMAASSTALFCGISLGMPEWIRARMLPLWMAFSLLIIVVLAREARAALRIYREEQCYGIIA